MGHAGRVGGGGAAPQKHGRSQTQREGGHGLTQSHMPKYDRLYAGRGGGGEGGTARGRFKSYACASSACARSVRVARTPQARVPIQGRQQDHAQDSRAVHSNRHSAEKAGGPGGKSTRQSKRGVTNHHQCEGGGEGKDADGPTASHTTRPWGPLPFAARKGCGGRERPQVAISCGGLGAQTVRADTGWQPPQRPSGHSGGVGAGAGAHSALTPHHTVACYDKETVGCA